MKTLGLLREGPIPPWVRPPYCSWSAVRSIRVYGASVQGVLVCFEVIAISDPLFRHPIVASGGILPARFTLPAVAQIQILERRQRIQASIDDAFGFYGDAHNLERITPPWLGFEVTTPRPIEMGVGTLIEYRLRLHGVPVRWRTRIEPWEPPHRFVDAQIKGPYSLWEHTHTVDEDGPGATMIRDRVRYSIPVGPLGELADRLLVRRDLKQIFDYRRDAVARELLLQD